MTVLIIEDDENKQGQIRTLVAQLMVASEIIIAGSYHAGLKRILDKPPDLVLLDMTMPTFDISTNEDGGRPQYYAGREILRQMDRRGLTLPVIVITQFDVFGSGDDAMTRDQLDLRLRVDHPTNYKGMVYYNAASQAWKTELTNKLLKIGRA